MATRTSRPGARETAEIATDAIEATARTGGRILTGHLAGVDDEGRILFRPEGSDEAPQPVVIGIALPDGSVVRAARLGQRALALVTDDERPRRVLVGLLRDRVLEKARDARPGELEVTVDGETLSLTAERQIELKCGKSSLLLRRDGRIVLSGSYVVSRSRGPMKIKGATIDLN